LNAYHEARGEGLPGIVATMQVVNNRLSINYRGAVSLCDVVVANKQFSWLYDSRKDIAMDKVSYQMIVGVAKGFISGDYPLDITKGATHYRAESLNDFWSRVSAYDDRIKVRFTSKIGNHIFYKFD